MLNRIITEEQLIESCPAPECHLSGKNVEQFVKALAAYVKLFAPAFRRWTQWSWSGVYLKGLLGAPVFCQNRCSMPQPRSVSCATTKNVIMLLIDKTLKSRTIALVYS